MSQINSIKDGMVTLTRAVRQLEESMPMCVAFLFQKEGEGATHYHYKSPTLQIAYNHLRDARMIMGDVLRVIGVENPYTHAYTGVLDSQQPKYMEGEGVIPISWEDVIANGMGENKSHESVCLGFVKTTLGNGVDRTGYMYDFNRLKHQMLYPTYPKHLKGMEKEIRSEQWRELESYCQMVFKSLKLANCYLGLRFGEIATPVAVLEAKMALNINIAIENENKLKGQVIIKEKEVATVAPVIADEVVVEETNTTEEVDKEDPPVE